MRPLDPDEIKAGELAYIPNRGLVRIDEVHGTSATVTRINWDLKPFAVDPLHVPLGDLFEHPTTPGV